MMEYQPKTARDLLTDLGVGRFNTTMVIETVMMAPATTDPASPPVVILTRALQENLRTLGFSLEVTGILDQPTAAALERVAGAGFLGRPWYELGKAVVGARKSGKRFSRPRAPAPPPSSKLSLGFVDLPDVPGGMVTYGVAAFLVYRALKRRK